MLRRAFTLIELLTVIAIIAILGAILFPVFLSARSAAYQMVAINNIRQLQSASSMYNAEHDETFMPASGYDDQGFFGWYGRYIGGKTDANTGLLAPYRGKKLLKDPVVEKNAKEYLGDHSGYGYNWGYLGSDLHISGAYGEYPQCRFPARTGDLNHPSSTVVFASSAYYYARWEGGDGQDYDFGFIDPLGMRPNNPNVAFRHLTPRRIESNRLVPMGHAIVAMADGSAKAVSAKAFKDNWFLRQTPN